MNPSPEEFDSRLPELVFSVRESLYAGADRKLDLYEKTLGLAVIPVLLRRAAIMTARKLGYTRKK